MEDSQKYLVVFAIILVILAVGCVGAWWYTKTRLFVETGYQGDAHRLGGGDAVMIAKWGSRGWTWLYKSLKVGPWIHSIRFSRKSTPQMPGMYVHVDISSSQDGKFPELSEAVFMTLQPSGQLLDLVGDQTDLYFQMPGFGGVFGEL